MPVLLFCWSACALGEEGSALRLHLEGERRSRAWGVGAGTQPEVSVENHWAVALSAGVRGDLAQLNSQLRRIDLSCKILAPAVSGLLMSVYGPVAAACAVATLNLLAWPVEAACLRAVFRDDWCRERLTSPEPNGSPSSPGSPPCTVDGGSWQLYFSQVGLWPSALALSMLHLTVLSFGQQMTAYVMILGLDPAVISLYRGVGEIFGLSATYAAPWLIRRLEWSCEASAAMFIWLQLLCLLPSVVGASEWARQSLGAIAASLLLAGGGLGNGSVQGSGIASEGRERLGALACVCVCVLT